jgi:hypothetical protein
VWAPVARTSVTSTQAYVILGLVIIGILAAGLVVILGRKQLMGDSTNTPHTSSTVPLPDTPSNVPLSTRIEPASIIRSWIAIALVLGLLIFCGAAFLVDDTTLRSTLLGGLVASTGAAVAFYFSSKDADQARADILGAAVTLAQGVGPTTAFSKATPPPTWTVGKPYQYQFVANGQPPPTYRLEGQKPDGLEFDQEGGILYGTPTKGSYTFSITASNPSGTKNTGDLKLTVTEAPSDS